MTTYAMSVDRLLQEQGVKVKTHDLVESTSPTSMLKNHDVVNVQSAYQTTITIDGQEVPFWTVASSAEQLLDFFNQNETEAAKITVNISNVYNKLTGSLIINQKGPVTVIADGKSSVAPNGKLPAASILDAKGITLGKEDRVSVEKDGKTTILRVRRVTHGEETRTKEVPFGTQTIIDPNLQPGEVTVRQEGENGEIQQTYAVTYVDGVKESETLTGEKTTKIAIDKVIAVGPEKLRTIPTSPTNPTTAATATATAITAIPARRTTARTIRVRTTRISPIRISPIPTKPIRTSRIPRIRTIRTTTRITIPTTPRRTIRHRPPHQPPAPQPTPAPQPKPQPTPQPSNPSAGCRLYHPSAAQAQAYASGAAAQRGWTGQNWTDLVKLWNRESGWSWSAENVSSGAYGIPQALPGSKMATFGANWKDDAAVQIDWGLSYIAQRYGSPSAAWQHSEQTGWY